MELTLSRVKINYAEMQRKMDRAKRQSIIGQLRLLQRDTRRSLRRRKRVSRPGQPPSIHSKGYGLKTILWNYNVATGVGIVGPIFMARSQVNSKNSTTVPHLLETGGTAMIRQQLMSRRGQGDVWETLNKAAKPSRRAKGIRWKSARVQARPYMMPTLYKAVNDGKIMEPWTGSFK